VVHYTTEFLDRTLDAVLLQYNPEPLKQLLIAGVVQGVPLYQAHLVQQWKERAAVYPDGLALAVVNRYAIIDHFWRWEMWLARSENLMMLYQAYSQIQQQLLYMLLGLNRVYYFGFKWLDVVAAQLRYKPEDLVRRLSHVYHVAPAEGAHELTALVEETYDLVEQHVSQVDVTYLRSVFHYQRPIWDAAPPFTGDKAHE
jgi:hypothetical protein